MLMINFWRLIRIQYKIFLLRNDKGKFFELINVRLPKHLILIKSRFFSVQFIL